MRVIDGSDRPRSICSRNRLDSAWRTHIPGHGKAAPFASLRIDAAENIPSLRLGSVGLTAALPLRRPGRQPGDVVVHQERVDDQPAGHDLAHLKTSPLIGDVMMPTWEHQLVGRGGKREGMSEQ